MTYQYILSEKIKRAGLVRINRPKVLNALNGELLAELAHALEEHDSDPEIGAMVITGDDRAFAAGADIKEMAEMSSVDMLLRDRISSAWDRLVAIKKPLIAAVSGWCLGGGNELAIACDMIVASQSAKFGQPELNLGIFPGGGATQRLPRVVGKAMAMEMVLNNRTLDAEQALQYGLVNYVYALDEYLEKALTMANEIAARAPIAIQLGKQAVNRAFETHLAEGIKDERQAFYLLFSTDDQKEGMQAFIEKRNAGWKGR